jgi:REP element-mobilizing transposase RayT
MRARQLSFLPPSPLSFGGDIRAGRRKIARPIDPKRPMHIVLRSIRARGDWSMLKRGNRARVHQLVDETASKYGVRVHRFSNVGNHLHLLVSTKTRRGFQSFLRVLTGAIAFAITGARKGNPVGRFWDKLAFSRVLSWEREFRAIETYFIKNDLESLGIAREQYILKPFPDS